jgi:tetrahedral aminopeptidase
MKELIKSLAAFVAPSGTEAGFQNELLSHVKEVADEVLIDTLGNGIAIKKGTGPHIMLAAHADEPGVMVIHIDENGFLRLIPVGNVNPLSLIGRHVRFVSEVNGENGVTGIVGVESKVKTRDIAFDNLYVDIGASSYEEANAKTKIGTEGVILEPVIELDDNHVIGRALDNRVGCSIAIEAFKQAALEGFNVSLVFTAQQTVGARGAKTAAYRLQPDLAIVIDAVPAGDMPDAERMDIKLGAGPAIKIMDGTAIVPLDVKDHLLDSAKAAGVAVQHEVWPKSLTDAGSIQLSVDGIPVGGVSYPARYVGGPSTLVDLRDAAGAVQVIVEAIRRRK